MNVADLVLRVKRDFGDEYDVMVTDADVYRWIYAAEMEVIRNTGASLQTQSAAANTFPEPVPTSVQIVRVHRAGKALLRTTIEELDSIGLNPSDTNTSPNYWYMSIAPGTGNNIYLWPNTTTDTSSISIDYIKTPVPITGPPPVPSTLSVPEVWHPDLVFYVLARAFEKRGADAKAKMYQDMFDKNQSLWAQEADSPDAPIYKGIDPLDYSDYYTGV